MFKQLFLVGCSFALFACATTTDRTPAAKKKTAHVMTITTMEEFLTYFDLEKVYSSKDENGAPAFVSAIPDYGVTKEGPDSDGNWKLSTKKGLGVVSYYFKGETGNLPGVDYDDNASATPGRTGGSWNCIKDKHGPGGSGKMTAKIDVNEICHKNSSNI